MLSNGNCLVVGGAGFIGSQLVDALLDSGHEVTVLDNFLRGKEENLISAKKNKLFHLVRGDASDSQVVYDVLSERKIGYVFHLAANSDIQASANDPAVEFHCTASTTWAILSAMRKAGVKNLFFSSTSAVYGELDGQASFSEEKSLMHPVSYYGGAKAASEAFISSFTYMNDMNSLVFRFPNVIGRRLTHGVIFDFISRLQKNASKLTVFGDGTQSKPYLFCDDLVKAIMMLAFTNVGLNVYQVGVESCSSVKFIAESVVKEMGLAGKCDVEFGTSQSGWKGDVPHFAYDLSKIHAAGWHASMTSDEAVLLTIKDALNNRYL